MNRPEYFNNLPDLEIWPGAAACCDSDASLRACNQRFAAMFGADIVELVGTRWLDGVREPERSNLVGGLNAARHTDSPFDIRINRANDSSVRLRLQVGAVGGHFLITAVDISDLVKAAVPDAAPAHSGIVQDPTRLGVLEHDPGQRRLELQAREREVRLLLDHVPAMIFIKDDKGTVVRANRRGHEFFGVPQGELEGRNCSELDPARAAAWLAEERGIIASRQPLQKLNLDYTDASGQRAWWRTDKVPWFDEETGQQGVVTISHDISDQYRSAEVLDQRNRELALVLDSVPAIVYFKDTRNTVRRTNRAGAELFGLSPETMQGRNFAELTPDIAGELLAIDRRVVESGEALHGLERKFALPNGHSIWVRGSIAPFVNTEGIYDGVVVALADITREKNRERELESLVDRLSASNGELERFTEVAARDMGEPLRMVASYVNLLDEEYGHKLDAEAQTYMRFATEGAARLQGLLEDLLDYANLGKPDETGLVDLEQALEFALANLRELLTTRNVKIQCDPLPVIRGNLVRFARVMQNLVHNAIKFTPASVRPEVQISCMESGEAVTISVTDKGIGIPAEAAETALEPFSRLHNDGANSGNGMGLAICRRIVEQARGSIWIERTEGPGTEIRFRLQRVGDSPV